MIVGGSALFWPARRAVIVADLHLEKASWFAKRGQMLPPYDSQATLQALDALIIANDASEVWCLGDNFHDSNGPERLPDAARAQLSAMTARADWCWITGNHDDALPDGIGGTIRDVCDVDGLVLRHQADPRELRPELSGHWHPKHRAVARGRTVSRACFVQSAAKLILPAFGALTGGLDTRHPELRAIAGRGAEAVLPAQGRALRFPLD